MEAQPHSRYPVIGTDRHDVLGVVSARALLLALLRGEALDLTTIASAPLFVPESLSGRDMLERFREGRTSMAFVVDEYGSLRGLVTLHDVLEGITGEFSGTTPDQGWAVQRHDGSWLLDGQIPLTTKKGGSRSPRPRRHCWCAPLSGHASRFSAKRSSTACRPRRTSGP